VDIEGLGALPGVVEAQRRGDAVVLTCSDSDGALRAFLDLYAGARDVEVQGARLEEAFLELTADPDRMPEEVLR
jgi:ABC-2 type transport system ATP-binding protein